MCQVGQEGAGTAKGHPCPPAGLGTASREGLSHSALLWGGLTPSPEGGFVYKRTLKPLESGKGSHRDGEGSGGEGWLRAPGWRERGD